MKKFTFKKYIPTGKWKSFNLRELWDIKLDKKIVGQVFGDKSFDPPKLYNIRFMVCKKDIMEDKNPNCEWKWITLKYSPPSFQKAKDFIMKHSDDIQEQFNLFIDE